jgi:hypothetical protein
VDISKNFLIFFIFVAGIGIAPMFQGYEPCGLLLAHPAMASFSIIMIFDKKSNGKKYFSG